MGKEMPINKPLSGLGWRMNTYMNFAWGQQVCITYYFLLFTYYFLLITFYCICTLLLIHIFRIWGCERCRCSDHGEEANNGRRLQDFRGCAF